mmetsp:Transcript_13748/g.29567  ORF Transcript_13748/g.29567 Transcript_13748/m.29567 type:complete len:116 (-) Transcript_13748:806-1153(-)
MQVYIHVCKATATYQMPRTSATCNLRCTHRIMLVFITCVLAPAAWTGVLSQATAAWFAEVSASLAMSWQGHAADGQRYGALCAGLDPPSDVVLPATTQHHSASSLFTAVCWTASM